MKDFPNALFLVATPRPSTIRAIGRQLDGMGVNWMTLDAFVSTTHSQEILECYDLLHDARSKSIYAELVASRIDGRYPEERYVDGCGRYFYGPFGESDPREIFVDCGAFVGDSLEQYLW